jgi:hypothetical protein
MRERPILFQGAMVRALLAGTKTQTRRVVNWKGMEPGLNLRFSGLSAVRSGSNWVLSSPTRTSHEYRSVPMPCPYGLPGDRLWVREAWAPNGPRAEDGALYRSDFPEGPLSIKFKPSIHMPRWASRITLEVTEVRVERLQDISRGDAMDEGCPFPNMAQGDDPRKWYAELWESINGPGSWDANPWVWVVEFKRQEQT